MERLSEYEYTELPGCLRVAVADCAGGDVVAVDQRKFKTASELRAAVALAIALARHQRRRLR